MKTRRGFLRAGVLTMGGAWAFWSWQQASEASQRPVVLVWSDNSAPRDVYPNDINTAVAEGLAPLTGWEVRTAGLQDPELGLSQAALDAADVLVWWSHTPYNSNQIPDPIVACVVARVRDQGMGFVALHSTHWARSFTDLMGTTRSWEGGAINYGEPTRMRVVSPRHPIARGIEEFVIPADERYVGSFDVPTPDAIVFDGVYERDGTVGWQGLAWTIRRGRVFYFRPGHETHPVYFQSGVRQVLRNAVQWAGGRSPRRPSADPS